MLGTSYRSNPEERLLSEILQDGLLVDTGAGVRFSHLSFQEYLAAEFLVMGDPSGDRVKLALKQFYSGEDWWKEVPYLLCYEHFESRGDGRMVN